LGFIYFAVAVSVFMAECLISLSDKEHTSNILNLSMRLFKELDLLKNNDQLWGLNLPIPSRNKTQISDGKACSP
jgi:hypothetical protein